MSRKKSPLNENSIGGRLRIFRESKSLGIVEFAKIIEISNGSLSDIENNKTTPSGKPIKNLVRKTDINIYWLFTGHGDPYRANETGCGYGVREPGSKWQVLDDEPEIDGLLEKTRRVLKSKTNFAESLSANIKSFHDAVQREEEAAAIKQELEDLKRRVDQINGGGHINNSFPPGVVGDATKGKVK